MPLLLKNKSVGLIFLANNYQNKTISSIQNNSLYGNDKYNNSYQRTLNYEERRRQYGPKGRFDNYTEDNSTAKNLKRLEIKYSNRSENKNIIGNFFMG